MLSVITSIERGGEEKELCTKVFVLFWWHSEWAKTRQSLLPIQLQFCPLVRMAGEATIHVIITFQPEIISLSPGLLPCLACMQPIHTQSP